MSLSGSFLVLGVSGSIAAYKAADLARRLGAAGATVQPIMTSAATRFITPLTLSTLTGRHALTDLFPDGEPETWTQHVDLGLRADGIVIAPATAQTLATLAHGFCDSMLAAVALSARCPVMVCPAMDHDMWHHPATQRNVQRLRDDGVTVMPPARGALASGLVGDGRFPEPAHIVAFIQRRLKAASSKPDAPQHGSADETTPHGVLAGRTVLVTAGPTREPIDPVRFLSNGSTGTMGFALAEAAARRGGRVTLLAGPSILETPPGVERIDITTADDLYREAMAHSGADLVIAAAAVSDYAPVTPSERKLKKNDSDKDEPVLTLHLRRTPDILAALGAQKREGQTLIGFALETHDGEANARAKLERKHLDWIVLNYAAEAGAGFGSGTNRVVVMGRDGSHHELGPAPKSEIAAALLDVVMSPASS